MKTAQDAIYLGDVTHKRVGSISHALRYRVFSLVLDCNNFDAHSKRLKLFSHNRFNLISLHDRDYGDGTELPLYLRSIAESAGLKSQIHRFVMLCYPRVLGYVFNPITVYYGLDVDGLIRLSIYEVTNTFGERKTYVIPAEPDEAGHVWQQCPKQFFVSPFNKVSGTYSFHLSAIADELTLGVVLKDNEAPVLRAHFRGTRENFTDRGLLKALAQTGIMTLKVMLGIHYEAARLWLKGLRTQQKPASPDSAITYFTDPRSGIERAPLVQGGDGDIENRRKADPDGIWNEQPGRPPVDISSHNDECHDQRKDRHNNHRGRPELPPGEKHRRPEPVQ